MSLKTLAVGSIIVLFVTGAVFSGEENDAALEKPSANVVNPTAWSAINIGGGRTLWWVYRDGREEAVQAPPSTYNFPKISPDGTKLVFTAEIGGDRDIWLLDLTQGTTQRLTFTEGRDDHPVWSPDGKRITFMSPSALKIIPQRGSPGALVSIAADGSGDAELLNLLPGRILLAFSWDKEGKILVVSEAPSNFTNFNIGMISTEWDRPYKLLLNADYHEVQPQLSPDGRWLAYCTTEESEQGNVYVSPFPDVNAGKWKVSEGSGSSPRWSADGRELFFLFGHTVSEAVMVVDVKTEPTFNPGKPRILFTGTYVGPFPDNGIPYDVHPDGERFLMMKE